MNDGTNVVKKDEMLQIIQNTPGQNIAELDFVRDRFIKNYDLCHPREKLGDAMYYRQVVHFKQLIAENNDLRNSDPFSLYACFITAAVKGYSFDPEDNEVYLLALGGKAKLWRQAGAHVRRLIQSRQIKYADQAKLVYKDDVIEIVNGRVDVHKERMLSEEIIAGYIKFVLPDDTERFFVYRKSDFAAWRSKSKQPNHENWNWQQTSQPHAGFLRTKIVKHACKEKVWAVGTTPPGVEDIQDIEIEDIEEVTTQSNSTEKSLPLHTSPSQQQKTNNVADDSFVDNNKPQGGTIHVDEDGF